MSYTLVLNPPISINLRLNLALKIFWILAFILIISLLILYVFQINALTGENYLLTKQEKKITEIRKESEVLKIDFAKANSLVNIENYFQNRGFAKTNEVKYIRILETSVAELP
jgi:DNA primase large subunit